MTSRFPGEVRRGKNQGTNFAKLLFTGYDWSWWGLGEVGLLTRLLSTTIQHGSLVLKKHDGSSLTFGKGSPEVFIRLHDARAFWELAFDPELKLGELYMDGRMTVEQGDVADLLDLLMYNLAVSRPGGLFAVTRRFRRIMRHVSQLNHESRAKQNVAHHYDLSGKLYDLFLDPDRQYSCAYFDEAGESLEEAQIAKKRHIAAKLNLDRPGLRVLDIGSGWGGMALDLARDCNANVLGITLSEEQLALARQRALKSGLADRCRFELEDYRNVKGPFDRIVSVGMFEHVGVGFYPTYFAKIRELLKDDGVALLHTIGRSDGPGSTNPWIAKYIFPGGYVPALSEMLAVIEQSGLMVTDVEVLRLHYAETLKEWRRRFKANWRDAAELYDERFCRMWEFYLAGAEMAFRREGQVVFQVQLAKRVDALPMTRDYMLESERTMRFAGIEHMPRASRAA